MAEVLSMIGHIRDIPRVLKKAYDNQDLYVPEMVDLFTKNNIKKVYFLGSGTSHNASLVMRNFFADIVKVEAFAPEPNVFTYHENTNPTDIKLDKALDSMTKAAEKIPDLARKLVEAEKELAKDFETDDKARGNASKAVGEDI